MRTTFDINDATLSELRELARVRRRPLRVVLEEVLQLGLGATALVKGEPVRLRTAGVGIKPAYLAQSLNQLYDQIEAEEGAGRAGR